MLRETSRLLLRSFFAQQRAACADGDLGSILPPGAAVIAAAVPPAVSGGNSRLAPRASLSQASSLLSFWEAFRRRIENCDLAKAPQRLAAVVAQEPEQQQQQKGRWGGVVCGPDKTF